MNIFSHIKAHLTGYFLVSLCLLPSVSIAQQFSAEQIASFRALPVAQQQALAKQFGIDPALITSFNENNDGTTSTALEEPILVRPLQSTTDNINDNTIVNDPSNPQVLTDPDTLGNDLVDDNLEAFRSRLDEIIDQAPPSATELQRSRNTVKTLTPFGYDVFAGAPTTFAPATDVPIPVEYKLGPGDTLNILLSGQTNRSFNLTINRAGMINAPEIGVLTLSGMSFSEATRLIIDKITEKNIGLSVHVTMGELRSVRIFILGEANRPGSYTVSALSTLTNALFVSGGIKPSGSLRNIQLKRAGRVVTEFDLYDLLVHGDNRHDARIMAGDVIFIPPVGKTISVEGEVNREAIFELHDETTIADIEVLFGGYKPTAFLQKTKVERIDGLGARTVKDIDLSARQGQEVAIRNGDIIKVPSVLNEANNMITIVGHVYRPGDYAFQDDMNLGAIISDATHFLANIDLDYALIKTESPLDKSIDFHQFTVRELLSGAHISVAANDTIYFFDATTDRTTLLADSLTQLAYQRGLTQSVNTITVNGPVKFPGTYPHAQQMTVEQMLFAAGGLDVVADKHFAVLLTMDPQRNYVPTLLNLTQTEDLQARVGAQAELYLFSKSGDRAEELTPVMTLLQEQSTKSMGEYLVSIEGEVRFPGTYPYVNNMSIADLVTAAGGLKTSAFTGETEMSRFVTDGQSDFTRTILPVNLAKELSQPSITIQPKDVLLVKRIPDWEDEEYIDLVGEFTFPGRYLIQKGETLAQVIARAGGLSEMAYPGATLFFRESVAEQQRVEIARLNDLLDKQLEIAAAKNALSGFSTSVNTQSLSRVADVIAETNDDGLGRISIDLSAQLLGMNTPLEVFANDRIVVPRKPSTVQVIGEVNRATAHVYNETLVLSDYIELAGGGTKFADMSELYVIRADGRIVIPDSNWFSYSQMSIKPGDTVVVPFDVALRDNLSLWQQVTRIIYNSAVSLSAIRGL